MCTGIQVTSQGSDQLVSLHHLSEQWPSPHHQPGPLSDCALQLTTFQSVLSPRRDHDIQKDGADSSICSHASGRQQKKNTPCRESSILLEAVCPFPRCFAYNGGVPGSRFATYKWTAQHS